MGKKAKAPPPVDYLGAARQQGEESRKSALASGMLSNPNMRTAYGTRNVSYSLDPTTGNYVPTVTDELSPEMKQQFDVQNRVNLALSNLGEEAAGRASDLFGRDFEYGGPGLQTSLNLGNAPRSPVDAGTTAQQAIMRRLQPQIEQNRASLRQNLANQGITPGSEAWQNAMTEQQQGESDLYSQAAERGIGLDIQARNQAVNEALQSGNFANTADIANFARQLGLYQLPIQEVSQALGYMPNMQIPQFGGFQGSSIEPTNIFGATQAQAQDALNRYNAEQAANNATTGGLTSLAGSGMMAAAVFM